MRLAYRDARQPLARDAFWISARRHGGLWTQHQADNWRRREFAPVARQVARDFPQFADLVRATPYATRHTFISCCLQAGISLATIAAWCGTSIQMISTTYGRMIRRLEGAPPVSLDEQFRAGKVEAMSLLEASFPNRDARGHGGSRVRVSGRVGQPRGSRTDATRGRLPAERARKLAG